MKLMRYFLSGILFLFFESCTVDTSGCEKNCEIQLSTCLLVAVNSGTANQSFTVPFVCYQVCDLCKDNCRVKTSSGGGVGSVRRGSSNGGGRSSGGGGSGGGHSGSGSGGGSGGGHGGSGIFTL
ncbi:hypothetical protein [Leptospira weilii]|uniref:hypothetical protein n=1 Tax=Leptospira weilii TaxID=28184 RepID=UPI0009B7C678|nr:hypothetical protein [Leptospira weilii]